MARRCLQRQPSPDAKRSARRAAWRSSGARSRFAPSQVVALRPVCQLTPMARVGGGTGCRLSTVPTPLPTCLNGSIRARGFSVFPRCQGAHGQVRQAWRSTTTPPIKHSRSGRGAKGAGRTPPARRGPGGPDHSAVPANRPRRRLPCQPRGPVAGHFDVWGGGAGSAARERRRGRFGSIQRLSPEAITSRFYGKPPETRGESAGGRLTESPIIGH